MKQTRAQDQTPPAPAFSQTQWSKKIATFQFLCFSPLSCVYYFTLNNNLTPNLTTASNTKTTREKPPDGEEERMEQKFFLSSRIKETPGKRED